MAATTGKVHSIAKQMFKVVFAVYFLVTLVTTTVYILTDYQTNKEEVLRDLVFMYGTSEPALAQALWEQDPRQIRLLSEELVAHPSLLGIKILAPNGELRGGAGTVVNDKGQSVSLKEDNSEVFEHKVMGIFTQEHAVAHKNPQNVAVNLGTVILYSNAKIVLQRISLGFWMLMVNGVIKGLALWVIFLVASRIWLHRPLSLFAQAAENLDLNKPQKLEIELPTRQRNEVMALAEAFNGMVVKWVKNHAWLAKAEEKKAHITEGLQAAIEELQPSFEEHVRFICEFQEDPKIQCRPVPLNRAFFNILLNGCQAIEMKRQKEESESLGQLKITTIAQGKTLHISFEDTGMGMPAEVQEQIFEPFYTTQATKAGLGMTVAQEIIEQHQGQITLQSQPKEGTKVLVALPLDCD